jgi:UDP-N-acetylmuramoyl-L-alanyl-D-glutamate--2,6-diaminopimelate ligase
MKDQIKKIGKQILGKNISIIRPFYHGVRSLLANIYHRRPSKDLTVIGITGTKGKTSTTILTGRIMNSLGLKAGYLSTGSISLDGDIQKEFINPQKNTTLDSVKLQQYLAKIRDSGCKFAILEMSSIGLDQRRHLGIKKFDAALVLNMFPEHVEYHGGWENYKKAKGILIKHLKKRGELILTNEENQIEVRDFFLELGLKKETKNTLIKTGDNFKIIKNKDTLDFNWGGTDFETNFEAEFQIKNLVFSLELIKNYIDKDEIKLNLPKILDNLKSIPGRMEYVVKENQVVFEQDGSKKDLKNKISILVDYAHEPESVRLLLENLNKLKQAKKYTHIFHILSCDGVGRDDWKKPVMGKLSYDIVDKLFLTTDNYDENDNPNEIIDLLRKDLPEKADKSIFTSINRMAAMRAALLEAKDLKTNLKENRIVIVSTGVGSEQMLTQPEGPMKWDERKKWVEIFKEI